MNRIYQGKVTKVQTLKPGTRGNASGDWQDLPNWPHVLWQHHQLFQDAVNYYIVCLLALANDPQSDAWKIREWMTTEGSELFVWGSFRRRGATRHGMRESVGPYLVPGTSEPTFEACAKAALAGNEAINPVRDFALQELLFKCSGNNPIKNQGAWMLARFCIPTYKGGFSFDAAAAVRKTGEMRLGTELYALSTQTELETFAGNLEISWVVNLAKDAKPFIGEMARGRLLKAVDHFQQVFGGSADTKMGNRVKTYLRAQVGALAALTTIREKIIAIPVEQLPVIPANNRSIPDRLEACFLFKYYPCPFTAELLKVSFPQQKPAASSTTESADNPTIRFLSQDGDPIERARGRRGYVFRAFTSLPCWNPADAPEPQWKEFDIVAFKEAPQSAPSD